MTIKCFKKRYLELSWNCDIMIMIIKYNNILKEKVKINIYQFW